MLDSGIEYDERFNRTTTMNACCDNPVILTEDIVNTRTIKGRTTETNCVNCGTNFDAGSITRRKANKKGRPVKARWGWDAYMARRNVEFARNRKFFILPHPELEGKTA